MWKQLHPVAFNRDPDGFDIEFVAVLIWACEYLALVLELKHSYQVYPYLDLGIAG